ncbi:hypothetical protein SAY87_018570 [Trapa incisa]|uniref:Uncharacterized protein n=1 Tax=Trapa incisa TaxID=236973 RepID=A0AAN7QX56_9MYRT|nr:hypothetical protein SAY87_018570 [Trapa incisa]
MDMALAPRTIVFPTGMRYDTIFSYGDTRKRRDWVAYLQAGAGIMADSNPDDEHRECLNKAAGPAQAIDLAEQAFVYKDILRFRNVHLRGWQMELPTSSDSCEFEVVATGSESSGSDEFRTL